MRTKATVASGAEAIVGGVLEQYAARGVFKGFSRAGAGRFKMLWHRGRTFELRVGDASMAFEGVLPKVPARSEMMKDYRAFVARFASADLPEHRRIDKAKVRLRCVAAGGEAGVEARVRDGDWEYAVKKLIHVVHETYLVFLYDGAYYDYLIETFDLDPDRMA